MSEELTRPDVAKVLAGLKDFQQDTVEYVFHRMYLEPVPARRFLVADEVGLGKTLVARGLIAKIIDHIWDRVGRIDIVYICSNADIARQNINRLNVTERKEFALPSRVTLLPTAVRDLEKNKLNLISLTPGTSFNLKSSLGTAEERALLYWLLDRAWNIRGRTGPLNVLQGTAGKATFRNRVRYFPHDREIDEALADQFVGALAHRVEQDRMLGRSDIRTRFDDLCVRFSHARTRENRPPEDLDAQRALVGELRALLAATCLRALQPDLIILDEFQRFKYLLEGDDDPAILARELFDYADEVSKARVLLLSATPYKMYTLSHDTEDDHYEDFVRTLAFLVANDQETERFSALLQDFRRGLYRLGEGSMEELPDVKRRLESGLRQVMVRTERLALSADRNGMLAEVRADPILRESDLSAYLSLQQIARIIEHPDIIEYWKSAPYLLSFMDEYLLKQDFEWAVEDAESRAVVARILSRANKLCLPWDIIQRYGEIDPANARLRRLADDTVDAGAWKLLWIAPSLPYYSLGGPYADPRLARFTKRLVFSCWRVVPKAIASLLSYEAERRMITSFEAEAENSPEARKRRGSLLRFSREADGRLTGMPVLALLYPSFTLARLGDPLSIAQREFHGIPPSREIMLEIVRRQIEVLLPRIGAERRAGEAADESWYWAAPLLLDLETDAFAARSWLEEPDLPAIWAGHGEVGEDESAWSSHVEFARELLKGTALLGAPPEDLSVVLAQIALAGPSVCALRMFSRVFGPSAITNDDIRDAAASIGWAFRTLLNLPEVTALIRARNPAEPYWRRSLEYSLDGCLQAVLDEYVHVLWEIHGLFARPVEDALDELVESIQIALSLRAPTLGVDDIRVDDSDQARVQITSRRMRVRFALRFGEEEDEETGQKTRADQVRASFNSPFWPFVLSTTSVGQEGLDFHPYCHAVVHWNLPSNPVDLEQREGRVHRYKGHAVRRNLALEYGIPPASTGGDLWAALFEMGKRDRQPGASDVVPFWVFPVDNGERIERHVLALPLSRDHERFNALRASLAVYRMVFGQPRQEDLITYLLETVGQSRAAQVLQELRIDLSPPTSSAADAFEPGTNAL